MCLPAVCLPAVGTMRLADALPSNCTAVMEALAAFTHSTTSYHKGTFTVLDTPKKEPTATKCVTCDVPAATYPTS